VSSSGDRATWPLALAVAAGLFALCALASFSWFGLCENAVDAGREDLCSIETDAFHMGLAAVPPLAVLGVALAGGSARLLVSVGGAFALLGAGLLAIAGLA
jgi:hypothetical protein